MFRRSLTILSVAVALIGAGATRASAACTPNAGPFCIDGVVTDADNSGVAGVAKIVDPNGSGKELGPINASSTKIGVINTAPTPMLGLTNPNAQVDLNTIFTQTAADPNTGHIWYYFAWKRDSNSGSGFISIELEQAGVPVACTGSGGYTASGCNPWKARQTGDFLILWDQQGGSTDISKRSFVAGSGFGGPISLTNNATAVARYTADNFGGEAAIDFTASVFPPSGACQSFANTIPGTVTGNSDTADYKDTVLSAFPPVSNCGSVTVTKVTQPTIDLTGPFAYTIAAQGGGAVFNGPNDTDCLAPTSTLKCDGTLANGGASNQIANLVAKSDYTLVENVPATFQLVSITCSVPGSTDQTVVLTAGGTFAVAATKTTTCVITNTKSTGRYLIVKVVDNKFGLSKVPGDFKFTRTDDGTSQAEEPFANGGVSCASGATCKDLTFNVGTSHTVVETGALAGFTVSYSADCTNAVIQAGGTATCTVTNTATQNTPAAVTRQKVLLFDRANLMNLRRTASDGGTMSVKFVVYSTAAACSADTTGSAGDGNQTVPFAASGTDTFVNGIATATGVEVKLDTAGTLDTTKWWRALFHQSGTNPPNADFLSPCTETTQVVINQ